MLLGSALCEYGIETDVTLSDDFTNYERLAIVAYAYSTQTYNEVSTAPFKSGFIGTAKTRFSVHAGALDGYIVISLDENAEGKIEVNNSIQRFEKDMEATMYIYGIR